MHSSKLAISIVQIQKYRKTEKETKTVCLTGIKYDDDLCTWKKYANKIKMQFEKSVSFHISHCFTQLTLPKLFAASNSQRRNNWYLVIEKTHPNQMGQWKMVTFNFLNWL